MPSLIFLKLHMFVAGMLIAEAVRRMQVRYLLLALLAPVISIFLTIGWHKVRIGMEALMILLMAAILWKFRAGSMMATVMSLPKRLLTLRFSTFLGDVSYSVYMLHLLIVIPVCGLLLSHTALAQQGAVLRFLEVAALCLPVTYLLAMLLYKGVEKPGIKLGKYVLRQNKAEPRIEPMA
jgi:peptidoglycan/LPS O-acetylase OafA/YrhL